MYEEAQEDLKEMPEIGAIWSSHSPNNSPVILVCKDRKMILYGFREAEFSYNKRIYSLPKIEDTLYSLNEAIWFSALDFKSEYWQVKMDEASKPLMAFTVGFTNVTVYLLTIECSSCIQDTDRNMFLKHQRITSPVDGSLSETQ